MTSTKDFQTTVIKYWEKHGRHSLPWRRTKDPYKILISEIMLQQTQVDRVVPYFKRFIQAFPSVEALARASLSEVLRVWSGLGYNRRAKLLRECAKEIAEKQGGKVPKDFAALVALPGVGDYTAKAVRVFAFNQPDVLIETNIRSAYLHHFFPHTYKVDDRLICVYVGKTAKGQDPRTWYSALMDYGAYLKKTNPNPSRRSKYHVKQSKFEGSLRQMRGILLRRLIQGPVSESSLRKIEIKNFHRIGTALKALESEHLIERKGTRWQLAQ